MRRREQEPSTPSIERDIRDNSLIGPAAGVEGPGESSCSIVEQTRSEPQDQAFPPLSILDLPLDILVDIAERLSPMDLLRMSHTNQELRVAAMIVATPQERRIQVQAICGSPCNRAPAASRRRGREAS
ncbi:F-box protein [Mesorhizobium sp. M0047]|uniref:F-box protein n=1 Tax=Mesorhizobium sp. M0047 TaxID=2956859 RepID=UPI00333A61F5